MPGILRQAKNVINTPESQTLCLLLIVAIIKITIPNKQTFYFKKSKVISELYFYYF